MSFNTGRFRYGNLFYCRDVWFNRIITTCQHVAQLSLTTRNEKLLLPLVLLFFIDNFTVTFYVQILLLLPLFFYEIFFMKCQNQVHWRLKFCLYIYSITLFNATILPSQCFLKMLISYKYLIMKSSDYALFLYSTERL